MGGRKVYLEPGPLTGTGLLLDWHDFQNLVLQAWAQEVVNNLKLLQISKAKEITFLSLHTNISFCDATLTVLLIITISLIQ